MGAVLMITKGRHGRQWLRDDARVSLARSVGRHAVERGLWEGGVARNGDYDSKAMRAWNDASGTTSRGDDQHRQCWQEL